MTEIFIAFQTENRTYRICSESFDQQGRTHVINAWSIQLTLIFQCYMQSIYL